MFKMEGDGKKEIQTSDEENDRDDPRGYKDNQSHTSASYSGRTSRCRSLEKRALLLLAFAACTAAAVLYWRQQTDQTENRPIHAVKQQAACGRRAYKKNGTTKSPNVILDGLNMSGPKGATSAEPLWTWLCRNDRCERLLTSETTILQSLATCNMLCASTQLWPQPTGPVSLATVAVPVRTDGFILQIVSSPSRDVTEHLTDAFTLIKDDMRSLGRDNLENRRSDIGPPQAVQVRAAINGSGDPRLRLDTEETYKLSIEPSGTNTLIAHSFCGARHCFETLSQLV